MDLSTLANVVEVGAATCVAIKFLRGRAVAVFAGWEGEKHGLMLLWGLGAAIPLSIVTLTSPLWLRYILRILPWGDGMAKFSETKIYEIHCPKCAGDRVVKIGLQRGQQRYRCKECRKDFRANGKATGRRMDAELMGAAIQDHYDGKSYKKIAEAVEKEYDIPEPSKATVYEWVRDFSVEAVEEMKDHPAKTGGGNWVADEMYLDVKGKKAYLWDIMDTDTRYILASHLSYKRDSTAARAMLRKALAASDGPPKSITTDKWRAYIKPIKDSARSQAHPVARAGRRGQQQPERTTARHLPRPREDPAGAGEH